MAVNLGIKLMIFLTVSGSENAKENPTSIKYKADFQFITIKLKNHEGIHFEDERNIIISQ